MGGVLMSLDSQTLRDAAAIVRDAAASLHDHPDCAPESWEIGPDWIREIRHRAARLVDLADLLDALAGVDLDPGDVLGWVGDES